MKSSAYTRTSFRPSRALAAAAAACGMAASPAAHAGVPVIDVAVLAQAIQEVMAWAEQYEQMVAQIRQLEQTYDQAVTEYRSITGIRGFGDILNNPAFQQIVPNGRDLGLAYQAVSAGGVNGLSAAARAIRRTSMIYDCEGKTGDDLAACRGAYNTNAQQQADVEDALNKVSARTQQIDALRQAIGTTDDPKAIAELTARIAAEGAQVTNDTTKVALMVKVGEARQVAAQQAVKEAEQASLQRTRSALDTFRYVPRF